MRREALPRDHRWTPPGSPCEPGTQAGRAPARVRSGRRLRYHAPTGFSGQPTTEPTRNKLRAGMVNFG